MFETLYGVLVGSITFCLWSLFTKGFGEDVASYYGKKWIGFLNVKGKLLEKKVQASITEIDDVFLTQPLNALEKIDSIVNKSSSDKVFTQLLDQTFALSVLLEKYNANVEL